MNQQLATPTREQRVDEAIAHLESVHRVVVLKKKAKVIPFPPERSSVYGWRR